MEKIFKIIMNCSFNLDQYLALLKQKSRKFFELAALKGRHTIKSTLDIKITMQTNDLQVLQAAVI